MPGYLGMDDFDVVRVFNLIDYRTLPGYQDPSFVDKLAEMFGGINGCWTKM